MYRFVRSHGLISDILQTQTSLAVLLMHSLEELTEDELKKFTFYLIHLVYEEYQRIPRGQLENLDRIGITDMIIRSYGEVGALKVTLEILKKMNLNDLVQRLSKDLKKGPQAGSELGDILEQNIIMSKRSKDSSAQGGKKERGEEEKREKDKGELMQCQHRIKCNLKQKFQCVFEGKPKGGQPTLLSEIYTELYITEGGTGGVNDAHEVRQIETASKKWRTEDTTVKCNDIFKPLSGRETPIRTVLTKGVAGIGKTVSVQKFILDWAEGKANQDLHFIFALPFRDLNLIKDEYSLIELLHRFVPELKSLESTELFSYKILFIFDGLDECRLSLDFLNNESWFDITKKMSLNVLLTNLVKGNLLPSALLWITSRPAAANLIPPDCIHRVTEIRGFSDAQKEEYFRRRFSEQSLANRIITHVKSSRSLFIMCHIPVFCWISATVLKRLFSETDRGEIPRTLTEMYTHFLNVQTGFKNEKYMKKLQLKTHSQEFLLKLGKLAFDNLEEGNLIFYEEDLIENDIDVSEASVYSGLCTEVFKEEYGLYEDKVYCFVHLSIQEYLAALYVFLSNSSADLLKTAVDQTLTSKNGHLDLYLRFLLGLSTDSSKTLLKRLLGQTRTSSHNIEETAEYIKWNIQNNLSPERTINLFHCLNELGDNSLVKEIERYLKSGRLSADDLSPAQYSALAFVMLMSDEELDVFDMKKFIRSDKEHWRLLPVVTNSRTAFWIWPENFINIVGNVVISKTPWKETS
ncbi:protein NLRC3-like isoform X1 [Brienomyrus brachyistius]|uniref:protein NLRC3-like isoform X1 n=1 Tax=Brienomyrus brachyistius TaxID=42636 RepID=UPI0020B42E4D|nr:protein NLRC3-like isoform X1 [Brienomyrus brachyistius]XP_048861777.1 protein NLRC3-like isoform X1 [Brienomyrus brachyistius]XP_048861778.1 protein NLRC3-like isoform X1 [Brienomyrus brachyistius]